MMRNVSEEKKIHTYLETAIYENEATIFYEK